MTDPNLIILYVDNPAVSAEFYADLLGRQPVESSATFAMFILASGFKLGLWSKHTVEPAAAPSVGGSELAFAVASKDIVDAMYAHCCSCRQTIVQKSTLMDFGYTFVALDPDGHRLRVYAPTEHI